MAKVVENGMRDYSTTKWEGSATETMILTTGQVILALMIK
jgi:hypothetical protein